MITIAHPFSTLSEYLYATVLCYVLYKVLMAAIEPHRPTRKTKVLDFRRVAKNDTNGLFCIKQ